MSAAVVETHLPGLPCTRGKVRDVYDLGDRLLLVATDRISAFDWVLPTPIPDKGRVLTQVSNYWFSQLNLPHHLLETDVRRMDLPAGADLDELDGRTVLVRKTKVVPIECVVRAYLSGSAWTEYRSIGSTAASRAARCPPGWRNRSDCRHRCSRRPRRRRRGSMTRTSHSPRCRRWWGWS
jgi:phosphoribosylaminoimidazole-succinocarboxamide synthase